MGSQAKAKWPKRLCVLLRLNCLRLRRATACVMLAFLPACWLSLPHSFVRPPASLLALLARPGNRFRPLMGGYPQRSSGLDAYGLPSEDRGPEVFSVPSAMCIQTGTEAEKGCAEREATLFFRRSSRMNLAAHW